MLDPGFLGVDIGSISVSLALIDSVSGIRKTAYRFHRGRVRETLAELMGEMGEAAVAGVACTTASPPIFQDARPCDTQVCLIAACRLLHPDARSILFVGGEKFGLIRFDGQGAYRGARTNSSCASMHNCVVS